MVGLTPELQSQEVAMILWGNLDRLQSGVLAGQQAGNERNQGA